MKSRPEFRATTILDRLTDKQIENFPTKIVKTDSCWIWQGKPNRTGYGEMRIGSNKDGNAIAVRSHRIAWVLANQMEIPTGKVIRHLCNNKLCCNPAHLCVGDHQDNMHDKVVDGTSLKGSANGSSKHTEEEIRQLFRDALSGVSTRILSERYNYHESTIDRILRGELWRHIYKEFHPQGGDL